MSESYLASTLTGIASSSQATACLSPSGVVTGTVADILSAAENIGSVLNTADALLSTFAEVLRDPISVVFSTGQPYPGTFITSPTASLTPLSLPTTALTSSTSSISSLSCSQLAALVARTGQAIANDFELAAALSVLFNEVKQNGLSAFSIDLYLNCECCLTEALSLYEDVQSIEQSIYVINNASTIAELEDDSYSEDLGDFVSNIATSFPNTPGIQGVATSVWVGGLGVSVNSNGTPLSGVPQDITSGVYNDITASAAQLVTPSTIVTITDYSFQQNKLNTVIALAIDNGLTQTVTDLLTNLMVTPVTYLVIKNRIGSVARRGDTEMLITLINALGVNNIPNKLQLMSTLISSLDPTDISSGSSSVIFQAGGVQITTNTNKKTLAALIADIEALLTTLGITIQQIFSFNTCDSIFCSQNLLNVSLMQAANQPVLLGLMDPTTVEMASMFA